MCSSDLVYDGVGPTDMIAVVSPAADENAFTGIVPQEGILQCLISQTVDVKSGQSATVVITKIVRICIEKKRNTLRAIKKIRASVLV